MKLFALLLLAVLSEGTGEPQSNSTQKVDPHLIINQFVSGASSVSTLSLRNVSAQNFSQGFIEARTNYGTLLGKEYYNQIVEIGEGLIKAIDDDWANLVQATEEAPMIPIRSDRINDALEQLNGQLETFLALKPGNQIIVPELSIMPPEPHFESDDTKLTASDAFLHLAKIKDATFAAQAAYANAIFWNGWKSVREVLGLVQTQYRHQILNKKALFEYRIIVDEVFLRSDIKNRVDLDTWARFIVDREIIVKLSDEYMQSLGTGGK